MRGWVYVVYLRRDRTNLIHDYSSMCPTTPPSGIQIYILWEPGTHSTGLTVDHDQNMWDIDGNTLATLPLTSLELKPILSGNVTTLQIGGFMAVTRDITTIWVSIDHFSAILRFCCPLDRIRV